METNKRNYRNLFVIKNNYYGKIMRIMPISFRQIDLQVQLVSGKKAFRPHVNMSLKSQILCILIDFEIRFLEDFSALADPKEKTI